MPHPVKIATCCYCGTRAALVLDASRHELACGTCGAPLHEMKMLPRRQTEEAGRKTRTMAPKKTPKSKRDGRPHTARKPPKSKRKKTVRRWGRKLVEELWDVVEDVFD